MIYCVADLDDEEETEVARFWVKAVPRVGEYLWITNGINLEVSSCYIVTAVYHWVILDSSGKHPGEDQAHPEQDPTHRVCLEVKAFE